MGSQTEVELESNLTFSVTTHDPDTGILTDADAVPAYRIYEDETAVPILTGDMAILDGVNTTGFYTELIACTTANGFEVNKSYTIYIEATVDGDKGGIAYNFRVKAIDEVFDEVVEGTLTMRQAMRILLAALSGKSSGGGTVTLTFRDVADSKARITATVDTSGNRTAITRDGT
jgi:hypothetical protein